MDKHARLLILGVNERWLDLDLNERESVGDTSRKHKKETLLELT